MINNFRNLLVFIFLQMLASQAFSATQPSCVYCQFDGEYRLLCQPNFVLSCEAVKEIPKKVDFKEKRPSKSHAKSSSSDSQPKPARGESGSGTLEQDFNPRPVSTTKYEWDILDPRPYTALLPEWYNSLSSRPSKESPLINPTVTSEYLERVNKQNLEFLHESVQELQNRAQEISDRFDNGLDLQSIASAIATSEGIAASLIASYINSETTRSESLEAALAQGISEYNRRFVENNPLDRHVQQVQSLADQLNREVAQDLEDRQARGQANKRLGVPLKDPFKTSSESREGQAIHRADSYLLWAQEETSKHSGDGRVAADKLLTEAHHTLAAADQSYAEGLGTHGDFALKLTYKLADAALSLAPLAVIALAPEALSLLAVVSAIDIGKSYYEFRTGKRLVGGEEITPMERHLAGVGTILGMLPAGSVILGRLGSFVSEITQLRAVAKFAAIGSENVALDEAADGVQGIFSSAKEIGWGAGELKTLTHNVSSLERYGPLQKGPLHNILYPDGRSGADTFRSSSYFEAVIKDPIKVYRVYGGDAGKLGSYWSRVKPTGPLQAQLDAAILPEFRNSAVKWVEMEIPPGTKIYDGTASSQYLQSKGSNSTVGQLLGGGNQVYIPRVDKSWITGGGSF